MDLYLWLCLIAGMVIGIVAVWLFRRIHSTTGVLTIYTSDPEKDLFNLHLDDLDDVFVKRYIVLKIVKDDSGMRQNNSDYSEKEE